MNELYSICPFSNLENFIRNTTITLPYFISHVASKPSCLRDEEIDSLKKFILLENISTLTIVQDVSCKFLSAAVLKKMFVGLNSERALKELFLEHEEQWKGLQMSEKIKLLASLNLKYEMNYLNKKFGNSLTVQGMITDVRNHKIIERLESNSIVKNTKIRIISYLN